jgi:hypothetical protein
MFLKEVVKMPVHADATGDQDALAGGRSNPRPKMEKKRVASLGSPGSGQFEVGVLS